MIGKGRNVEEEGRMYYQDTSGGCIIRRRDIVVLD